MDGTALRKFNRVSLVKRSEGFMKPRFNEKKATEIACLLLKLRGTNRMAHLKLMKLMYLIDREALLRWGRSITKDNYSSMPHGMVLSRTYNLITEESSPPTFWKTFVSSPKNYEVELLREPDYEELSAAEVALVKEVFEKFGTWNRWELRDYTHELPEWRDPNGSSLAVEYSDVLRASERTEEEIYDILLEMDAIAHLDRLAV